MGDSNFPERRIYNAELMSKPNGKVLKLTEEQMNTVVQSKARAAEDFGTIVKELVSIYKINQQSEADIALIEAETEKFVKSMRAEIDRQVQQGQTIRTRGEVAVGIIAQITSTITTMPDHDVASRHKLIDSILPLVQLALA